MALSNSLQREPRIARGCRPRQDARGQGLSSHDRLTSTTAVNAWGCAACSGGGPRRGHAADPRRSGQSVGKNSRSASTRNAEASGWPVDRPASTADTRPARVCPRAAATRLSAAQNSSSSATDVRCPASEKLRLTRLLSCHLPSSPVTSTRLDWPDGVPVVRWATFYAIRLKRRQGSRDPRNAVVAYAQAKGGKDPARFVQVAGGPPTSRAFVCCGAHVAAATIG